MPDRISVLIVDDDRTYAQALARALRATYTVTAVSSADEALASVSPAPDVVLLDLCLAPDDPSDRSGLLLLDELQRHLPQTPVIIVTGHGDVSVTVECLQRGATNVIEKGADLANRLRGVIEVARAQGRLTLRVRELQRDLDLVAPRAIVGISAATVALRRAIQVVAADGNVTVLLRGETGVGKELVARAIHAAGPRGRNPFVPVMLNALPSTTVESELFGYERGAFTDARERRGGYLEHAHGGVLFLDEIGEVDAPLQAKLLRLLEERVFQRLGSTRQVPFDAQVVTATNAALEARVQQGVFRSDLYYRLRVHEIVVPPLRERREDIAPLVQHFIKLFHAQGKRLQAISDEALARLCEAPWPGNVRELRNALESAFVRAEIARHERIEVDDLPDDLRRPQAATTLTVAAASVTVPRELDRLELTRVAQALETTGGRKSEAWALLGYHDRETLYRRVRRILKRWPEAAGEFPRLAREFGAADRSREGDPSPLERDSV